MKKKIKFEKKFFSKDFKKNIPKLYKFHFRLFYFEKGNCWSQLKLKWWCWLFKDPRRFNFHHFKINFPQFLLNLFYRILSLKNLWVFFSFGENCEFIIVPGPFSLQIVWIQCEGGAKYIFKWWKTCNKFLFIFAL